MSSESLDTQPPRIILVSAAPSISEPEAELLNMDDGSMMFTVSLTDPMDTGESAPSRTRTAKDTGESTPPHTRTAKDTGESTPPHTRTAKDTEESTPPHTRTAKDMGESTPSRTHAGTIDPREISDLLRSRPTIRRGKPERCATVMFDRNDPVFRSVQYRRPHTTGIKVRRRSSMPLTGPERSSASSSSIIIEDIEEEVFQDDNAAFARGDVRRSTRRIKDRIKTYQQNMVMPKEVRHSVIADFRYVKWPKLKSRLQVIRSWELWKGHIKEVEGHFGTAVVSYFIFLRWLFVMNIIIFALWFGFVVAPNIAYITVAQPPGIPSTLSCSYDPILSPAPNFSCIENLTANTSSSDDIFFLPTGPGYTCNITTNDTTFSIRSCLYEERTIGGVAVGVAYQESPEVLTASRSVPTDCFFTNASNVSMPQMVKLCSTDIQPHTEWYQYVIDFFLGEGLFNDTVLFHGRYSDSIVLVYNHPLAFMILIVVVYAISVVLLVYNLGQAYNENYLQFGKKRQVNFCNKLFSAWDYNITDSNTAKLKKVQIKTDLEEELADWEERKKRRTNEELAKVIAIRIFTNLLTVVLLLGGGVAIFFAAQLSFTTTSTNGAISLEGLLSPVIITAFNIILPFIFSFLAQFERFKTQSGEIKMTLLRTIIVRLASLIVLVGTLFIVIRCTQNVETLLSTASGGLTDNACGFSLINITEALSGFSNTTCPVCWETYIGQEFYKLALTNFIITSASTIAVETGRNVISRIRWKGIGEKIGKANFNIPKSILDLIYTQALLWLGFVFTPLSPAIILATTFLLFYVKKYSLIWNLVPTKRKSFRAARTNFVFIALMLGTLFMVIIVIGFAIASLRPSSNCGPFRGRRYMYSIITDLIADIEDCSGRAALEYFGSFGFLIPVFVFLTLIIYAQQVTLQARKKRFELIKKQLILEGANVTHIVGTLDDVLSRVTATKEAHLSYIDQDNIKTRMERVRNSSVGTVELVSQL